MRLVRWLLDEGRDARREAEYRESCRQMMADGDPLRDEDGDEDGDDGTA